MYGNVVNDIDAVKLYMTCQGPHDTWRKRAETHVWIVYAVAMCGTKIYSTISVVVREKNTWNWR